MKKAVLVFAMAILLGTEPVEVLSRMSTDRFANRLCQRVERRFGWQTNMWNRVNQRIIRSFHFSCAKTSLRLRPSRSDDPDEITDFTGKQILPPAQNPFGIALMRFDMSAHPVQDIVIRSLTFKAASGSLLNAINYSLWVDHDRNGVVETLLNTNGSPDGGTLTFADLYGGGYIVTEDTVSFEVRAQMSASPESDTLQLQFATNGVEAEELDGEVLNAGFQISQQRVPAKIFTILEHGNLFVSQSRAAVGSHQLPGGEVSDDLLRLTFRAADESVSVTNLQISSLGSAAESVSKLLLYREGSSLPFAEATVSGCSSEDASAHSFCVAMPPHTFIVPDNERIDLIVRALIDSDSEGGINGENIQLWLSGQVVINSSTGSGSVRAKGLSSNEQLSENDGDSEAEGEIFIGRDSIGVNDDITGPAHNVTMAKIIEIANASTDADGTPVPTGSHAIGSFLFRADQNSNMENGANDAVLDKLLLSISATNVSLNASSFTLFNTVDSSTMHSCIAKDAGDSILSGTITGTIFVECTGLDASSLATTINSPGSITLTLKATIVDPNVHGSVGSSLSVSLQDAFSRATGFGINSSHLHWIDRDAGGDTDVYWVDLPMAEVRSTQYEL